MTDTMRKSSRPEVDADGQMLDRAMRLTAEKVVSTTKNDKPGMNLGPIFAI